MLARETLKEADWKAGVCNVAKGIKFCVSFIFTGMKTKWFVM
jgi:hypothetical protein